MVRTSVCFSDRRRRPARAIGQLDRVNRQARQHGKIRVAGPEVVDRDLHPHLAQAQDLLLHDLGVAHRHQLGDLELEHARREAGLGDDPADRIGELGILQLEYRDVHRNGQRQTVGEHAPDIVHRPLEHEEPDVGHKPGLFGNADELAGRDVAPLRVAPTHQRLDADDRTVGAVDLRLVVDAEAALPHGDLEVVSIARRSCIISAASGVNRA